VFSPDGHMSRIIYLAASFTFGTLVFLLLMSAHKLLFASVPADVALVPIGSHWQYLDLRRAGMDIVGMIIIAGIMVSYGWARGQLHLSRDPKMHDVLAGIYLAAAGAPLLLFLLPFETAKYFAFVGLAQVILMMMLSSRRQTHMGKHMKSFVELMGGRMPDPLAQLLVPAGGPHFAAQAESLSNEGALPLGSESLSTMDIAKRAEELRLAEQQAFSTRTVAATDRGSTAQQGFGRRRGFSAQT